MHYKKVKEVLSINNGMNIYRGCSHGCIYCDSRSKCYNINHDFEDIEVKLDSHLLLEKRLKSKKTKCMIGTGSMSDPYIPLENQIKNTRKCLEIIEKYGFGLSILTKSNLILRDLDLLKKINEKAKCIVQMTITTYDDKLCKILEPSVCSSEKRFEVLKIMKENNIETVVWLTPILPFINDSVDNIKKIVDKCYEASVKRIIWFGAGLTLREGNRDYFYEKLDQYFPGLKEKYQKLYGLKYEIISPNHNQIMNFFCKQCEKYNIIYDNKKIFEYLHDFEDNLKQLSLF